MKKETPEPEEIRPSAQSNDPKSVKFTDDQGEVQAWDDYWEDMLLISRGPRGWNIGCA